MFGTASMSFVIELDVYKGMAGRRMLALLSAWVHTEKIGQDTLVITISLNEICCL